MNSIHFIETPKTMDQLVADVEEALSGHLADSVSKGSALIAAGISMLATEHGESGLNLAVAVSQGAVLGAAETLGLDEVWQ